LLHEQSFLYLAEAKRVLKPGGKIVVSFLEFAMSFYWSVFAQTIADEAGGQSHPLNVFIERGAILAWAEHLDLEVIEFRDGNDAFVPLPFALTLDGGETLDKLGNLGQSICVLAKR
jgi:2-polyprenyl-3-methyl-5-hydroxy-6-metoxy-1,4-benzoquinol methylase